MQMNYNANEEMDLSIIIPLYRGQKYCMRLLEMIQENCEYEEFYKMCKIEVLFVNDYPKEKILIERKNYCFKIDVIEQEKNNGIHGTRVRGIQEAAGRYILLLDQDDLITMDCLYKQYSKCIRENVNFCVCNGWLSRFRVLQSNDILCERVNNLEYYLVKGNAITSPGQVMMKRKAIPKEWLKNIQQKNGADDFLLWILILKNGYEFKVNPEYLYYHTPERTPDSISKDKMVESLKETLQILKKIKCLTHKEAEVLECQINDIIARNNASRLCGSEDNFAKYITLKSGIKFKNMFFIMYNWMKAENCGSGIWQYMCKKGYNRVAIHGMGYIGECLYQELCKNGIRVVYAIDCLARDFRKQLPIITIDEDFEKVDLIITTVTENAEGVKSVLSKKGKGQVLTLEEIIEEIMEQINGELGA